MNRANARRATYVLLGLILIAFVLRIYRLDGPALRGDEAFSVLYARNSLGEMFRLFTASTEPHPPLSFLVLHYWAKLAGESEFAMRLPSTLAGVLVVPLIYALGRLVWDRDVGLAAAALLAINPFYIWHAQEARMYAMLAVLCIASTVLYLMTLRTRAWYWWVAYGLITALATYTHYYAFLVVGFHGIYACWTFFARRGGDTELQSSWRTVGRWLLGLTIAGLLYAPWLSSSWSVLTAYHGDARSSIPFLEPVYRCLLVFGQGQTLPRGLSLWFLPLWGGLFVGGWVVAWRRDRRSAWFMLLYLLVPWTVVFIDSLQRPAFDERYFMVSTPSYYLVIALALVALTRRHRVLGAIVAALILGISTLSLHNHYHNPAFARAPDWRALNDFYARHVRAGDVVVANYPDPAIRYYYDFGGPWEILPGAYPVDREATECQLDSLVQANDRVWLTPQRWPLWDDEGLVESYLDAQAERVATYQVSTFQIVRYHTRRLFTHEMRPLDVYLEGGIRLLGYVVRDQEGHAVDRLEPKAGEDVSVTLYWRAEAPLDEDYVVFAHLLDPTGWLRGQQDNQPRQGTFPTRAWKPGDLVVDRYQIALAGDAPAGEYAIEIGMYRPADGTRLATSGTDADVENDRVLLRGHISVR